MNRKNKLTALFLSVILLVLTATGCGSSQPEAAEIDIFMMNPDVQMEDFLRSYTGPSGNMTANVEVGIATPDITANDAIKNLNTKMMSRSGPDIIILDDIDPQNYIDSGLLADLSSITEKNDGLIKGIAENGRRNGKTYYMPLSFGLVVMEQKPEAGVNFDSLSSYVTSMKDKGLRSGYFENLASIWYRIQLEPEITAKGNISDEQLRSFYENLADLMDISDWSNRQIIKASLYPGNYMVNPLLSYSEIYFGEIDASLDYLTSVSDMQVYYSMVDDGGLEIDFAAWDEKIDYIPRCVIAVNENARHKEAAMEMVSYLLSAEGQNRIADNNMIPVNRQVIEERLDSYAGVHSYLYGNSYEVHPFSEKSKTAIYDVLDSIGYEAYSDIYLMEIILSEAMGYLNGEVSLDDAVSGAMSKASIYLAE